MKNQTSKQQPINLFLSVAASDLVYCQKLLKHLASLQYEKLITPWHMHQTIAGSDKIKELYRQLDSASIILLLLSPDFMASDECYNLALPQALKRQAEKKALAITILLRPVDYNTEIFQTSLLLPHNKKPITLWKNRDEAFLEITKELRKLLKNDASYTIEEYNMLIPKISNVPYYRNLFFTGREYLLNQLHHELFTTYQVQAISGLGGIGKTQIALEYTYLYREEYHTILWINAASQESVLRDLATIADLLDIHYKKGRGQYNLIQAIKAWFTTHDNWLFIIDNVEDLEMLHQFMPVNAKGHILLTTRLQATGNLAHTFNIENLNTEEAMQLLLYRAKRLTPRESLYNANEEDRTEATNIVKELGNFPLAIDQAGAYIEETGNSLSSYLKQYKQKRITLLKRRGLSIHHPESVVTTWSLSFQIIKQKNALATDLLYAFSFLDPDAIPRDFFVTGGSQLGPEIKASILDSQLLEEAIELLLRYSFIQYNVSTDMLIIHPLLQLVIREMLPLSMQRLWAKRFVQAIHRATPEINTQAYKHYERYLPQMIACTKIINHYGLEIPEAAIVLYQTAYYLGNERELDIQAEPLYQQALKIFRCNPATQNTTIATILDNLGLLYTRQGDYKQAEQHFQQALMLYQEVNRPKDIGTAYVFNNLALLYSDWNRYKDAVPLFHRALTIFREKLGAKHFNVAITLDNLANLYRDLCNYKKALSLFQEALKIFEQMSDPDNLAIATNLHNQAVLYESLGNDKQAETLYERALSIRKSILIPDHPDIIGITSNLGVLYSRQGKNEQAEFYLQKVLESRKKTEDLNHPSLAHSMTNLATYYNSVSKYEQAEPLFQEALKIYQQLFGPAHTRIAETLNNFAGFYLDQNKYEQAESLFQEALKMYQQIFGDNHPDAAQVLSNLADLYSEQGDHEKARQFYLNALEIADQTLGACHPTTEIFLRNIALHYQEQEQLEQIESLLQHFLKKHEEAQRPDRLSVAFYLYKLGVFYYRQNSYEKTEQLFQRALSIHKKFLGLKHIDTAITIKSLAILYSKQGNRNKAKRFFQQALDIYEQLCGKDHPDTIEVTRAYMNFIAENKIE